MHATSRLCAEVVAAIRTVVGNDKQQLHEPRFWGNEARYLQECINSTFVSSVGPFVNRIEDELCAFTGARHAVAVVNGTAALHIALLLAGVRPGDEVLVPALTFVATANAVAYCQAVPHFVDSEERTLGIDPIALRKYLSASTVIKDKVCFNRATGRAIRVLLPMHTFGHPADMEALLAVASEFHLLVVEDAAESLGSYIGKRHTGSFGLLGALSFNGNKTITTGGGGAILTDDANLAAKAKHLTTTGKVAHRWEYTHDSVAYNYRMPNLNAALGVAQLEQLPGFLSQKRALFNAYASAFAGVQGVKLVQEPRSCASNYWLQTLLLDRPDAAVRDALLEATNATGLMTRPAWTLMHHLPMFCDMPRAPLPVAESLALRLINIPSSAGLVEAVT
jgi:perosamine synthetase